MVEAGHCTRNDWALAVAVATTTMKTGIQTWDNFLMGMQPPPCGGLQSAPDSTLAAERDFADDFFGRGDDFADIFVKRDRSGIILSPI
jgi:hypothetical protein